MNYNERIYSESEIKLIKEIFDMYIKQIYDEDLEKLVFECKEMFLEQQKSLKEIERLNNIINELKSQLQQKENIIKEVRELLENDYFEDGSFSNYKKVFELLDKENKE